MQVIFNKEELAKIVAEFIKGSLTSLVDWRHRDIPIAEYKVGTKTVRLLIAYSVKDNWSPELPKDSPLVSIEFKEDDSTDNE